MKTFDIIYIALICVVIAVCLWAYWDKIKHLIFQFEKGVVVYGGNKKRRKRKRKTI